MKRSVLMDGLLAALCALSASRALAQYSTTRGPYWPGITDHFVGNTWISSSTTFNNSGSLIYSTSILATNTGPLPLSDGWMIGDYWWAADVLVQGSDGVAINNTGTIQSIVSGYGSAQAVGILSLQSGLVITNWGTIDGQVQNFDGEADGVWTDSQSTTIINNGTISARSKFSARGINTQNSACVVNNGTVQAIADAGTDGITANRAKAHCFGVGGSFPMYFENNGQIKCIGTSSTATNEVQLFTCWNNGPVVFKNTGLLYSENSSPNGHSQTAYFGAQSYDLVLYNSGTITNAASDQNGLTMWYENDGDRGNMILNNSGTITSPNTPVLFLTGHWGPPGFLHTYYTNSGTFSGGQMRLYGIPATIYEAGQVHATLFGLSDASDVHVMGLPTIDPTLECGGNNSTLEFNLIGTLQQVNGSSVSGTNLSAFSLGPSGNIVVSGKTYKWSGAGSGVSGIVNPGGCVPAPWQQQDIGAVGVAGGAVYCGGMFTMLGSGTNIGGTADAFHYVSQSASNNCSITAPVTVPTTTTNAQAGVMIRASLNANAANVFVGVTGINAVSFQYRSSDGGSTSSSSVGVTNTMYWVKLAQNGSTFTGYYSVDGTNWTQLGTTTIGMGAANVMGLAFCNQNNSSNGMGTFYGVTCTGAVLVPSAPAGLTATAGVEQVTLNWQASGNTASYNIGRSTVSGGPYTTAGNTSGTNFTDVNLAGRTTYYYVVTAVTPGSQGTNSAQVSATPSANVPLPWVAQDLGPVGVVGNESYTNGVFTVSGAGADIDNSESFNVGVQDTCRFIYETNSGNCAIVARVTSVQNIDPESKGGVMIRSGLSSDAANVIIGMTPGIGVVMSYRSTNSANGTLVNNVTNLTVPCWVVLVQTGTSFSGYYSTDGNSWILVGTTTVSMTGTEYLGLTVSSRDNNRLGMATFDHVSAPGWPAATGPTGLTATATSGGQVNLKWNAVTNATGYNVKRSTVSGGPYSVIASGLTATNFTDSVLVVGINYDYVVSAIIGGVESANSAEATVNLPLPSPWVSLDVGTVGLTGSAGYGNNTFTVAGAGADIWGTADAFRFAYVPVTGNCTIMARVASLPNIDGWSKAGVMIRASTNASAANAFIAVTPGNGVTWQTRSSTGGASGNSATAGLSAPYWVKLVRSGNTFTGSYSPDGVTWTQQGTATFTMAATAYVGLALTSHNSSSLCTATFDNVTATGWSAPLPPPAPGGLAAAAVSSSQIALAWNAVTNAANYNVKRATTNGGPYTVVATGVTATNYNDTGLADGTPYFYVVSAVNVGGESTNSVQATATTLGPLVHQYSFSETSGTNVADSVGGPVWNGTLPNGGTFSNGQLTLASASSQYATLPAGIVGTLSNFTIVAWVRLNSTADWTRIFDFGSGTTANMFLTPQSGGSGPMRFAITTSGSGSEQQINSSSALSTGGRHQVAVTLSGNTGVMYLDGSPVGTNSSMTLNPSSLGSTANNYLGKSQYSDPYLNGSLDEFRIYKRALTAVEVAQVYLAGTVTLGNLSRTYDGTPKSVTATTTPSGLAVNITYNGSANAPTNAGSYTVIGTINDANYQGSATNMLVINSAIRPQISLARVGTNLTFSWSQTNTGFTLQSCTNLASGGWKDVTLPAPQIAGDQWQVTLPRPVDSSSAFYRLSN
jgi:fibronectin type 3 domain-containing protein